MAKGSSGVLRFPEIFSANSLVILATNFKLIQDPSSSIAGNLSPFAGDWLFIAVDFKEVSGNGIYIAGIPHWRSARC